MAFNYGGRDELIPMPSARWRAGAGERAQAGGISEQHSAGRSTADIGPRSADPDERMRGDRTSSSGRFATRERGSRRRSWPDVRSRRLLPRRRRVPEKARAAVWGSRREAHHAASATSSIGLRTLDDLVASFPEEFRWRGSPLAGERGRSPTSAGSTRHAPSRCSTPGGRYLAHNSRLPRPELLQLRAFAALPATGTPMSSSALVGSAGLPADDGGDQAERTVALANKETCGGQPRAAAAAGAGDLLPVDSEHSAVFSASPAQPREIPDPPHRLGRPFRTPKAKLARSEARGR